MKDSLTVEENTTNQPIVATEEKQPTAIEEIQLSTEDKLFNSFLEAGLVNETFRAWYCQAFFRLGKAMILSLAGKALIDGKDKQKYFSYLIKRQMVK